MNRTLSRVLLLSTLAATAAATDDAPSWVDAEQATLRNHVQLTPSSRFRKAGESYFSPDASQIIFQAIEREDDPAQEEAFYQMFVGDIVRKAGRIAGLENIVQLSPPGSSNTCGWFHPTEPGVVTFGSTVGPPSNPDRAGYQRDGSKYVWQFPKEMDVVRVDLAEADGEGGGLTRLIENADAYLAEGAVRSDGRYIVFCEHVVEEGKSGGDLVIMDLHDGRQVPVTVADGYDGGPFFSPEGDRLTYRSDRHGNDLLQIFVSELSFDHAGNVLGVDREFQLTDNAHVNWAPFWHPSGRYLVYATSEMGHDNYEVFLVDADAGDDERPTKYGTRRRRVTQAAGFDGLPVFNADGSVMMWTSQRSGDGASQVWAADFVMDLEPAEPGGEIPRSEERTEKPEQMHVADPDTGMLYVYDPKTHQVSLYDPKTHAVSPVTDAEELQKAMRLFTEQREGKGGER